MAARKSKISKKELVVWALIIGVTGFILYHSMTGGSHSHLEGHIAPPTSLVDENGGTFNLEEMRGQVVVLNVYATWCPPCRKEIPDFAKYWDEVKGGDDVMLYGVVFESGEAQQAVGGSRALGVNYPILLGSGAMAQRYHLHTYPTTIVIDREGIVRHQVEGAISYSELQELVSDALTPVSAPVASSKP